MCADQVFVKGGAGMLFAPKERGQGLLEYAMIISLVAIIVLVVIYLLGPAVGSMYSNVVIII